MTDPKRLMDEDATELERLLLGAVARERPSRSLTRRMRNAVGLAGSLFTFKAAAAALSVAVVVAGATVAVERRHDEPASVAPPAPARLVAKTEPPVVAPPAVEEDAPAVARPMEPPPAPVASAKPRALAAATPDLRAQMRVLDEARGALRRASPAEAVRALDRYRKSYPNGAFTQEASVLRVEALNQSGDHAKAAKLAREFIRQHADSPHVERLSQGLESAPRNR